MDMGVGCRNGLVGDRPSLSMVGAGLSVAWACWSTIPRKLVRDKSGLMSLMSDLALLSGEGSCISSQCVLWAYFSVDPRSGRAVNSDAQDTTFWSNRSGSMQ